MEYIINNDVEHGESQLKRFNTTNMRTYAYEHMNLGYGSGDGVGSTYQKKLFGPFDGTNSFLR
jgi:hypothetical protein